MFRWFRKLFNAGHDGDELAKRLGMTKREILETPLDYHEYSIKKKSGKRRQIAAPNPQLKLLQRRLLRRVFKKLKVSPFATGFQPGISFVDNACCHQSQDVVIRIDLVDFFPSIKEDTVKQYYRRIGWNRRTSNLLAKLTTHNGVLPQGAPTSPKLSNLVNNLFDFRLQAFAKEFGAVYTRYADDITFSMSGDDTQHASELLGRAVTYIRQSGYRPHMGKKFDVRRQHHRQIVTGLVVNNTANLPREKRRWLRAVEHRTKLKMAGGYLGPRPTLSEEQLQGWRSLRKMIDKSQPD